LTINDDILNVADPATTLRLRAGLFAAVVPLKGVQALRAVFRAWRAVVLVGNALIDK
jgi:hypothetical protein